MHDVLVALGSAAAGWAVPRLGAGALRMVRGDVDREISEIQRLVVRVGDLEALVDLLRKALDKHLIREAAIASAAEFVIAIVKLVPRPTSEMMHLRDRAQQLLTDALAHIATINRGERQQ